MGKQNYKVKLSPKLQLGIGRSRGNNHLLRYVGLVFVVLSIVLGARAGYLVLNHSGDPASAPNERVAGDSTSQADEVFSEHTVKKGDTLFNISQQYGIEWTTLATLNGLKAPFDLQIGQKLKIPIK
jgi:nucleoid-associated protein YgaU